MEESIRKHRDQLTKTHNEFRQRWANATAEKKVMENEKQALEATVAELRSQMEAMATGLNGQLEALRNEKAALERSLDLEKATSGLDATASHDLTVVSGKALYGIISLLMNRRPLYARNAIICLPKKQLGLARLLLALHLMRQLKRLGVNGK